MLRVFALLLRAPPQPQVTPMMVKTAAAVHLRASMAVALALRESAMDRPSKPIYPIKFGGVPRQDSIWMKMSMVLELSD